MKTKCLYHAEDFFEVFPAVLKVAEPLGSIVGVGRGGGTRHLTPDAGDAQVVKIVRGRQVVVTQLVPHHVVLAGVPDRL